MRILIVLFLSLMMRDVFSLRGLYLAEVSIIGEGEVPSDTEPQVICTITSIEPAGADEQFVKYITSSQEVAAKSSSWRDNSTAQTFEECADAAAASGAKMFLFDEQKCQISDDFYARSDYCGKDHSQMVYMDIDAVPKNYTVDGTFCNLDWTVSCITGSCINYLVALDTACSGAISKVNTFEGHYHLLQSGSEVKLEETIAECEKYGAQPCAPADESSISEFIEHLDVFNYATVGLNSTDNGDSYMWATGVPMPKNHTGWQSGELFEKNCAVSNGNQVTTYGCQSFEYFCCMVPYYAN